MSRPFSYNDENFTVIGNVLFIHVIAEKVEPLQPIVEIPYEIGRRLLYKTAMGFLQIVDYYGGLGYSFVGTVIHENGKYYLTYYVDFPKTKGAKLCKNYDGAKYEVTLEELLSKLKINKFGKRATKEQVERLKYNMENGIWKSQKLCDQIN